MKKERIEISHRGVVYCFYKRLRLSFFCSAGYFTIEQQGRLCYNSHIAIQKRKGAKGYMQKSYIAFDIETTGLNPQENEILEIGALKVRNGRVAERFIEFICPESEIPASITALTGIREDMVSGARNVREVLADFADFCGEDILIGHNVQFDFSFVWNWAQKQGLSFEHEGIDTLKIARAVHPSLPSKKLEALCDYYQIQNNSAHRAYHDALATAKLYQTLAHYFEEKSPSVFHPEPLMCRTAPRFPATAKQVSFIKQLIKRKGLKTSMDLESLTRDEASRTIERILAGEQI